MEDNFTQNLEQQGEMYAEKEVMINATLINTGISIKASEKKENKKS